MPKTIISLCDYSGVWSQPYADAGYEVIRVDLGHHPGSQALGNVLHFGGDIVGLERSWTGRRLLANPYGVLAAPPCCCFCRPGARWWPRMDERGETAQAVELFRACLRICKTASGWWALENPPGRHQRLIPELGPPAWQWQPWQYGESYGKQTYIWGTAAQPTATHTTKPPPLTYRTPNGKTQGRIARMSSNAKRQREQTPAGFAAAFFAANP